MKYRPALWMLSLMFLALGCASQSRLKPPRVASSMPLDYPLSAQLQRLEGEVALTVFVNPQGKSEEVNLSESSGYPVLDEAALKFVEKLDFSPGTLDGKPVGAWTRLVLRYKLTEMVFETERWLAEVRSLQREIEEVSDPALRETLLRRLYTNYVGCVTYVESQNDPAINAAIKMVVAKSTAQYWRPFEEQYAFPFILFDDFIARYPDSEIIGQARQDLLRHLMDMEMKIRIRSLKSQRVSSTAGALMELLERRLKALQPEIESPVN